METMIASEKQVTVRVGRRTQEYGTMHTAVLHHNMLRDKSGNGASQWPTWIVECEGEVYHISYNGRVWCGMPNEWTPDTVEVEVSNG